MNELAVLFVAGIFFTSLFSASIALLSFFGISTQKRLSKLEEGQAELKELIKSLQEKLFNRA